MREKITIAIEIAGASSICAGVGLRYGLAFGLITFGCLTLVFSFLAGSE